MHSRKCQNELEMEFVEIRCKSLSNPTNGSKIHHMPNKYTITRGPRAGESCNKGGVHYEWPAKDFEW